jgi:DNA (cytosine-5)-methyltransferase 1
VKVLDLFCGAGGASGGIALAGHTVHGVDVAPMPHYPFPFTLADALVCELAGYDAYFASPPCQAWTRARALRSDFRTRTAPRLIDVTRARLVATGKPFVIENVMEAPLRHDLILDGSMFGLSCIRRRAFEIHGGFIMQPGTRRGELHIGTNAVTVCGAGGGLRRGQAKYARLDVRLSALGIDWPMSRHEVNQAIPPAYTRYIFNRLFG